MYNSHPPAACSLPFGGRLNVKYEPTYVMQDEPITVLCAVFQVAGWPPEL